MRYCVELNMNGMDKLVRHSLRKEIAHRCAYCNGEMTFNCNNNNNLKKKCCLQKLIM